jgi:Transposase DDE domain/Transposase domain (DUF772)
LPVPLMSLESPLFARLDQYMRQRLVPGSLPWLLATGVAVWFPAWLAASWRGQSPRGRPAWPAPVLLALLLLRWTEEGVSRRGACEKRASSDMDWRAAMGLPADRRSPDEKTVREFEAYLRQRDGGTLVPRYLLVLEHIVRACLREGVMKSLPQVATDSTPMWCYGAVKDTVRLMGEGLQHLGRLWATATQRTLEQVAQQWQIPLLLAKSVKGHFEVDWHKGPDGAQVVAQLAEQVTRAIDQVRQNVHTVGRRVFVDRLLRACRHLVRVLEDNLETDKEGRLVIAHKVAKDRLISLTDPQARHGHKSQHKTFDGYKIHFVGDLVSGLLLSLCVTQGNEHDGQPAHRLIRRAKQVYQELVRVLGDTAYGAARLRYLVRGTTGVELMAPPPPDTQRGERLGKRVVKLNLVQGTATCAAEQTTSDMRWVWSEEAGVEVRKFKWPKALCDACPLSSACRGKQTGGHTVLLHPYEEDLRRARQEFNQPEVKKQYRLRTQCERLVNQLVRHGGRKARAFGLGAAQVQAHLIAMTENLRLLAQRLIEAG